VDDHVVGARAVAQLDAPGQPFQLAHSRVVARHHRARRQQRDERRHDVIEVFLGERRQGLEHDDVGVDVDDEAGHAVGLRGHQPEGVGLAAQLQSPGQRSLEAPREPGLAVGHLGTGASLDEAQGDLRLRRESGEAEDLTTVVLDPHQEAATRLDLAQVVAVDPRVSGVVPAPALGRQPGPPELEPRH
jgi:hypothetical protein